MAKINTEADKDMLYQGASLSQLSLIFKRDNRTTAKKIHGNVKPVGVRNGSPIYAIHEVAPFLCPPNFTVDEYIERMTVNDLPTELSKEFWSGMRSRQLFEKEQGLLVPLADVKDIVGAHNKIVRERILLVKESVERQVELSERARAILTDTLDSLLEDMRDAIIREFAEPKELNAGLITLPTEEVDNEL